MYKIQPKYAFLVISFFLFSILACACNKISSEVEKNSIVKEERSKKEINSQNTPTSFNYTQFLDHSTWLIGDYNYLWKTEDRGQTWRIVFPLDNQLNSGQSIRGLSFINEKEGFLIYMQKILKSDDGGTSWYKLSDFEDSFFSRSCFFIDGKHGWVVGSNLNSGFLSNPSISQYSGKVFYTDDGGITWQNKKVDLPKNHHLQGEELRFRNIHFPSLENGVIVGDRVIFWTNDGGMNWKLANGLSKDAVQFYKIWTYDDQYIWVTAWQDSSIFASNNGGKSWKPVHFPFYFGNHSASVAFVSRSHIFTAFSEVFETKDNAQSWKIKELDSEEKSYYYIGKALDNTLVVLGMNQLTNQIKVWISSDNGNSWQ